jgi:hypothetical protein
MDAITALEVVNGVDLTGRTCVITGASAGLGRESARALAATGARTPSPRHGDASHEDGIWVAQY